LRAAQPEVVDFVPDSVDATRISDTLGRGRARVIINSFHHFSPGLARAILHGAAADGAPGIFLAEGFERNPLGFASFVPAGLPALMAGPVLSERRRLQKALLAWATPVGLLASIWDGVVSTLRVYTEAELRDMVAPLGSAFEWTYGRYSFGAGGRGYYFYGVRRPAQSR
jgi:hypothetical protein